MLWNIAPTLSRLWHSGALTAKGLAQSKALRVTFVPDPAESSARGVVVSAPRSGDGKVQAWRPAGSVVGASGGAWSRASNPFDEPGCTCPTRR